jgi:hypothetical protein
LTKATGVGRGGKRPNSGRKPAQAAPFENPANQTDVDRLSPEDLMEVAAKTLAKAGQWDAASKAAKRLADHQARGGAPSGKKVAAQATAQAATAPGSRFAPPPPPKPH